MSVIVYSTKTCPWCVKERSILLPLGVSFEVKNVAEDKEAAMFVVKKTNQMGVPVVQIGEKFIVGFNADEIKSTLQEQKII